MENVKSYIAILDVGHGNSAVMFERGESCIVDCGPGSCILEFLTSEGITNIENVFLSHSDQDHIEGLVGLLASDKITIGNVYVNSDGIKTSTLWDDLTYVLSKTSVNGGTKLFTAITRTEGVFKCGEISIETIGPTAYLAAKSPGSQDRQKRKITSNSVSASFRVYWQGKAVAYLAGDIDQIALDDLKDHDINIQAPLLVFPHHGGNSSGGNVVDFTNELCDLTIPNTVIFSIGRNRHSNPRQEVVKAVRDKIENVRIACTQLSKHCAVTLKNGIAPVHLNSAFAKGRETNECCGGTFIIELTDSQINLPDQNAHLAFIAAATTSPICRN
jgi:beta-lactamase superfamily II metal-dependent hydrolase